MGHGWLVRLIWTIILPGLLLDCSTLHCGVQLLDCNCIFQSQHEVVFLLGTAQEVPAMHGCDY